MFTPERIFKGIGIAVFAGFFVLALVYFSSDQQLRPAKVKIQPAYPENPYQAALLQYRKRVDPNTGGIPAGALWKIAKQLNTSSGTASRKRPDNDGDWMAVDDFFQSIAITRLTYDPNNTQVFYFCTGEATFNADVSRGAGIWRSEDGGDQWEQLTSTANDSFVFCYDMLVHPQTSDIYIGTRDITPFGTKGGLYRSSDGGDSWEKVFGQENYIITDIEVTAGGGIFIGSYGDGIYYSETGDTGTFDLMNNGITSGGSISRIEIATAPSNDSVVYAIPAQSSTGEIEGIYRSVDKGQTWNATNTPDSNLSLARYQAWYDLILKVDPNDEAMVVAGGLHIWRTPDGGDTWQQLSHGKRDSAPEKYVHVDQHEIVFHTSDTLYFGNDGGIYMSQNFLDADPDIKPKNDNYNVTQYYTAAIHPDSGSPIIIGGTQDNGSGISTHAGISAFERLSGADGSYCEIDHQTGKYYYTTTQYKRMYRRDEPYGDVSDTITNPYLDNEFFSFINPIAMDASDPEIIYQASERGLWRLPNASMARDSDWVLATRINTGVITAIGTSRSHPHTVFYGRHSRNGTILRVDTAHLTDQNYVAVDLNPFAQLPNNPPGDPFFYCSSIAVDPNDANHLVITYSNYGVVSVWESQYAMTDSTQWKAVEGNLPDLPVNWAMLHPDHPEVCYLATDLGVFYTDRLDGGNTVWKPTNGGLANVRVEMLRIRESDLTVVAATHGRGLFTGRLDPDGLNNAIQWEERGPNNIGGRTRTIMVDPNDPSGKTVWAAGVSGGLWKTTNIHAVGIGDNASTPREAYRFMAFPNPFSSIASMSFQLPEAGPVSVNVFDLDGKHLTTLVQGNYPRGKHTIRWSPDASLPTGIYMAVASFSGNNITRKLLYLR